MRIKKPVLLSLLFLLLVVTGCSQQVHTPTRNVFALKHDSLTSELIVFTTPKYSEQIVSLIGVTSYTIGPESKMILYSTVSYGSEQLVVIPKEGNEHLLTNVDQYLRFPNISPDGKMILFEKRDDITGESQIMSMEMETSRMTTLRADDSSGLSPIWSKDGKYISYLSPSDVCDNTGLEHCYDLSIVSSDSRSVVTKIIGPINYYYPVSWSQGSNEVVFSRLVNGHYCLVIYNLLTKKELVIESREQDYILGVWSENSEQVAFARSGLGDQYSSYICFFANPTTTCSDKEYPTITGILWIDGRTILFGTYNRSNDETTVKLLDATSMRVVDMGKYSGYIDTFQIIK